LKRIDINWLFFHESCDPKPLRIFTDAAQECRKLFPPVLERECKFRANVNSIKFYKVRPMLSPKEQVVDEQ
jgi:hypothetical protein